MNKFGMDGVKNYSARSSNIFETFHPFNRVSKLFGFFSFTVQPDSEQGLFTTFFDRILLGFWVSLHLFLFVVNSVLGQREPEVEDSLFAKHGWHKIYLLQMASLAWVVVQNFNKRFCIAESLRLMNRFDLAELTLDYQVINSSTIFQSFLSFALRF